MPSEFGNIIDLEISDPWEFGTVHGTGPFRALLVKFFTSSTYECDKLGVAKLDVSVIFKGKTYEYILMQSRHTDVGIEELKRGNTILCNLLAISENSADSSDPLEASKNDPKATILVGSVRFAESDRNQ